MKRISNRSHDKSMHSVPQVHYIHMPSEKTTETIYISSEPEVVEVEKIVHVEVEVEKEPVYIDRTVYIKSDAPDLTYINESIGELIKDQAEMVQRIIELQEELDSIPEPKPEKSNFKLKVAIGLSLALSILSLCLR